MLQKKNIKDRRMPAHADNYLSQLGNQKCFDRCAFIFFFFIYILLYSIGQIMARDLSVEYENKWNQSM